MSAFALPTPVNTLAAALPAASHMLTEARQAPQAVDAQWAANAGVLRSIAQAHDAHPPSALLTIARGSSDHAASHCAFLAMAQWGCVASSLPMSLVSLYGGPKPMPSRWALAVSQSGQSPDVVGALQFFANGQSPTIAMVNDASSPLAHAARWVLALHAGRELSVAATKSFIAQLFAGASLVAHCTPNRALLSALAQLPATLERAVDADWSVGVQALLHADRLFVLGRGSGLGVAMEAALKFKETCGIQAEAFSSAEVQHGPMALVAAGYPVLVFAPHGPAHEGLLKSATAMRERGARVLLAAPKGTPLCDLPIVTSGHVELDPISLIQSFYPMVEALARARGCDPDQPRHLNKVTLTH